MAATPLPPEAMLPPDLLTGTVTMRDVVRVPVREVPRSHVVCISSESLLAGATEVQIEHRGALYRLKQTSLGKLILTK